MKLRNIVLLMLTMTLVVVAYVAYMLKDTQVASKMIDIPDVASFQFENAIYGDKDRLLVNPIDLAIGNDGTIYVTDSDNNRIQAFAPSGEFKFQFGKLGKKEGELSYPVGIVTDSKQNLYIVEALNQRISVFDPQGKFLKFLTMSDKNSPVKSPTAIAIDSNDQLYVIDKQDQKVKKLSPDGELLMAFGGYGKNKGKFQYPLGIAVNARCDIIVSDTGNGRVQVFDPAGTALATIGGYFDTPSGVSFDQQNNLYITDPVNCKVIIAPYRGEQKGTIGDMGVATDSLYVPEGIEVKNDRLYVADKGNNRIVIYKILYKK